MDHYKVLGLNKDANKAQIKEAFRKLALKFHPDKHSHSSKLVRDNALVRFKQASEAYEILIDDRKRSDYNGYTARATTTATYSSSYTPRYSSPSASKRGFHFDLTFRFLTTRTFLLNLTLASVLLAGAAIIDTSGEALWKMQNSGKSFEEAVESIEKKKKKDTG